jgi:hypothetical protein
VLLQGGNFEKGSVRLVSGFHHCDKIPEQTQLKRRNYFSLMVSEVSIHYGREGVQSRAAHIMAARKGRKGRE